jgi:UTP--glucose-1-phosphate uridylyltransferase
MRIRKAVITAAAPSQRRLPLQTLVDRGGRERGVLGILIEEVVQARVEEIGVVVHPGDAAAYAQVCGEHAGRVRFIEQEAARGYADAIWRAREFTSGEPFLHLVSDHLAVSRAADGCAARLVEVAESEDSAVSAVQATREGELTRFGAVGGQRVAARDGLYQVDTVLEKPTPTEAEQRIIVPGLRAGHYLCFFGMHVLTPAVMDLLGEVLAAEERPTLSSALALLPRRERYLALCMSARRYDLGARYGLLQAQLALALAGRDRDEVLTQLIELLAQREASSDGSAQ